MFGFSTRHVVLALTGLAIAALMASCGQASQPGADGGAAAAPMAPTNSPITAPGPVEGPVAAAMPPPTPVPPPPMPIPPLAPLPPPKTAAAAPAPLPPVHHGSGAPPPLACASQQMASFPWPKPPQPSVFTQISIDRLFADGVASKTLLDVGRRLSGAIARAGYQQPTYLGAGCNGFAIILDLEHIESDGTRMSGAAGFAPPGQQPEFSLADFFVRLFHAPAGHYRQIVIVVSDEALGTTIAAPNEDALRRMAADGASALPPAFAAIPLTWRYKVIAAIYEFRKGAQDGDARFIPPNGRLGATVHLIKARLLDRQPER